MGKLRCTGIADSNGDYFAMTVGRMVFVGKWFGLLTIAEQEAVLWHEFGHIEYGHQWKRIWWLISFQWKNLAKRVREQELEADAFAVQNGHAEGLMKFLKRAKHIQGVLHPTYDERVGNVRNILAIGESPCQ